MRDFNSIFKLKKSKPKKIFKNHEQLTDLEEISFINKSRNKLLKRLSYTSKNTQHKINEDIFYSYLKIRNNSVNSRTPGYFNRKYIDQKLVDILLILTNQKNHLIKNGFPFLQIKDVIDFLKEYRDLILHENLKFSLNIKEASKSYFQSPLFDCNLKDNDILSLKKKNLLLIDKIKDYEETLKDMI